MKKFLCIALVLVVCIPLLSCAAGVVLDFTGITPKSEQYAILRHLEKKYGEKFVIKEATSFSLTGGFGRGRVVEVYPKGHEDEVFDVYINVDLKTTYIDNYGVKLHEKRIQSVYTEWILTKFPQSKVSIKRDGFPDNDVMYDPEQSLDQFVTEAGGLGVRVTIAFSEAELERKDELFKELSALPETEPVLGLESTSYYIGFFTKDGFDNLTSDSPIYVSTLFSTEEDKEKLKDVVAATAFIDLHDEDPWDFLDQLNQKFKVNEEILK